VAVERVDPRTKNSPPSPDSPFFPSFLLYVVFLFWEMMELSPGFSGFPTRATATIKGGPPFPSASFKDGPTLRKRKWQCSPYSTERHLSLRDAPSPP